MQLKDKKIERINIERIKERIKERMKERMNYIIIDMSYFIFYRYYALKNWWKHAKSNSPLESDAYENSEFLEKFEKTFLEKIKEIPKKLKIQKTNYKFLMAKDCPRRDIWRNEFYGKYKENREDDDVIMVGPFFRRAYEILEKEKFPILFHPKLEGDDCIALMTHKLKGDNNIFIIASDMDYLQLLEDNVKAINLKYKLIDDSKKWSGDAKKDLFCKIVMGDKSDGIPSIFAKCGIKTAIKCYDDEDYFHKKMERENAYEKFILNKKIIDFNEIPEELKIEFLNS